MGDLSLDTVAFDDGRLLAVAPVVLPAEARMDLLQDLCANPLEEFVLLVRWESVASWRHAALAAQRAVRAFRSSKRLGKTLATEFAVCLAGIRQVSEALRILKPVGRRCTVVGLLRDLDILKERLEEIGAVRTDYPDPEETISLLGYSGRCSCSGRGEALAMEASARVELER